MSKKVKQKKPEAVNSQTDRAAWLAAMPALGRRRLLVAEASSAIEEALELAGLGVKLFETLDGYDFDDLHGSVVFFMEWLFYEIEERLERGKTEASEPLVAEFYNADTVKATA